MTIQRRSTGSLKELVVEVLRAETRPLTGLEIFDRLNARGASRFLSQTYRALNELRASGAIRRIELTKSYALGAENVMMNLLCERCGHVDSTPANATIVPLQRHAAAISFKPERYIVEILGECGRCVATH